MDRRMERGLFIASLSLNLFWVAAFMAVFIWGARTFSLSLGQAGPLRQVARSLDPAHRQALIKVLQAQGRAVRPETQRVRALRQDAWRSLEAPDFDPAKVKDELAQARALNQDASGKVQDSLVDFAAALPIDQRASLGRAMLARMPRIPPQTSGGAGQGARGASGGKSD